MKAGDCAARKIPTPKRGDGRGAGSLAQGHLLDCRVGNTSSGAWSWEGAAGKGVWMVHRTRAGGIWRRIDGLWRGRGRDCGFARISCVGLEPVTAQRSWDGGWEGRGMSNASCHGIVHLVGRTKEKGQSPFWRETQLVAELRTQLPAPEGPVQHGTNSPSACAG